MQAQTGYAIVAETRARGLKTRMALAAFIGVTALIYSPGWWPVIWFVATGLGQWIDSLVMRRYLRDPTLLPGLPYRTFTWVMVFLNTALYSGITLYVWQAGGEVGKAFAIVQACGGLLHVTLHMHYQRSLLIASTLAHATFLLGMPVMSGLKSGPLAVAVAVIGCLLYISHLVVAVRQSSQTTQALREATVEAERASAAKTDFLATISHEIRTPMNAVISAGHLLQRTALTPEQAAHVFMLTHASDMLLGLLNDVLDLSRIEAGKMVLAEADLDLHEALRALIMLWQPQAAEKGCTLVLDLAEDVPVMIRSDPLRLRQILFNLLSNAVKFTEVGGIVLHVRRSGLADDRLVFEVQDTGCGIATDVQARLFSSFEQADAGTTRRYGGSGLGLSISRKLAEIMQGDLSVESQPGRGSVFRLEMPLVEALSLGTVPQVPAGQQGRDEASDRPLSILVAEDHEVNRRIIGLFLEPLGWHLSMTVNGAEAVKAAQDRRFDVVLMDMQMPVMDGLDAAHLIRNGSGPNANTPIVALTANVLEQHRRAWHGVGADAFLSKPIDPALLIETLRAAAVRGRVDALNPTVPAIRDAVAKGA